MILEGPSPILPGEKIKTGPLKKGILKHKALHQTLQPELNYPPGLDDPNSDTLSLWSEFVFLIGNPAWKPPSPG